LRSAGRGTGELQKAEHFRAMDQQDQSRIIGQVVQRGSCPERGYVFIAEAGGAQNFFAHATAFAREFRGEALYAVVGRAVSFELETGLDGRRRAVRVEVFGEAPEEVSRWT
jgi:cold shock CspA family protein